jgi:hypothetical protein
MSIIFRILIVRVRSPAILTGIGFQAIIIPLTEFISVQITNRRNSFGLLFCIAEKKCFAERKGGI